MLTLAEILDTFDDAISTARVGVPMAARVVVHVDQTTDAIASTAGRLVDRAASWLADRPERITTFGSESSGNLSTLVRFREGRSAIVSVGVQTGDAPLVEIVIWGTIGVLSWEGDRRIANEPDHSQLDANANVARWCALILQSSASRQTVSCDDGQTIENAAQRLVSGSAAPVQRMASKPPYGVLLVAGDYTHQPSYSQLLANDPRCHLIGLTDSDDVSERRRALNRRMADRLDIPLLPDLNTALSRDDVHIVSICAEPYRRAPIIIAAANAGKHIYLDKPLAATLQEAVAIDQALRQSPIVTQMWSLVRLPAAMAAREVVQSGTVGDVSAMHIDLCFAKGYAGTADVSEVRRESMPVRYEAVESKRELTNVGVYCVTQMFWSRDSRVRRVCATTGNYFFAQHQANDMEDFGQMLIELDDGAIVTICAGRTGWQSHSSNVGLNRTIVCGSTGAATLDGHRNHVAVWSSSDAWSPPDEDPTDPMAMWGGPKESRFVAATKQSEMTPSHKDKNDIEHFLDCVESGQHSDVCGLLAAKTVDVLLAGYRAAATGAVVDLM